MAKKTNGNGSVGQENLRRVLDMIEAEELVRVGRIAEASGVSLMTVRRAVAEGIDRGILSITHTADPITGRRCGLVSFADGVSVPVLDLSSQPMRAWVFPMNRIATAGEPDRRRGGGNEVPLIVHEPNGEFSVEENLRLLLSRVRRELLNRRHTAQGTHSGQNPQKADTASTIRVHPVVILPPEVENRQFRNRSSIPRQVQDPPKRLATVVTESLCGGLHTVEVHGGVTLVDERSAVIYGMTHAKWARGCTSLLCLRGGSFSGRDFYGRDNSGGRFSGGTCSAALCLCRNGVDGTFFTPSLLMPWLDSLTDTLRDMPPYPSGEAVAHILHSAVTVLRPDAVILDGLPCPDNVETDTDTVRVIPGDNGRLPLCVRGAAMLARRRFADRVCGQSSSVPAQMCLV